MGLADTLRQLRTAADFTRLLAELGHDLPHTVLPPGALPIPLGDALVAGRPGGLEWIGCSGRPAPAVARSLSRGLRRQGRLAAVFALDSEARQLAIAITVDRTATWRVPLDTPTTADLDRLRRLGPALTGCTTALGAALALLGVLETEEIGRRFFLAFRAAADRIAAGLTPAPPRGSRDTLALIQLTRVLFLYFVQAKGWLDGRPDFLRRAVDEGLGRCRPLHRHLFRPLFFGTLNRRPEQRGRARRFGRIPFLNGGLFEPHPLERAWRGEVPDACWREAFDGVFEHFHFTVLEGSDPQAIAPDMLGRVFEGLMGGDERRAQGAYYTPAPLVGRLVDAALVALVTERLRCPGDEAAAMLADRAPGILPLLGEIRLLDPAVGSGAFLLGALERLAELRAGEAPPAGLKRRILARNLYGVDLNPMAVRLTELRLWLAVIAAEPEGPDQEITPLPNLDGLIRQGDSLLEPSGLLARLGTRPEQSGPTLRRLREVFIGESGPGKRALLRRLRQAEVRALEECLHQAALRLERDVTECLLEARAPTLFGERRGLDRPLRTRLRRLRADLAQVRRLHHRLVREGQVPWFSYEAHFGDVLAAGGFDVVVGNPPWVRAEHLPPETRAALAARYRWWRTSGRGFRHQPDLSLAFVERSLELVATGGVVAMLLPAKLGTAAYGRVLRRALVERTTLHVLADVTDDPAATFEATTYPIVLVASRRPPDLEHRVRLTLDRRPESGWPQARLARESAWILAEPELLDALTELHADHPSLGEELLPRLGVKTGANAVFLDPPAAIEPALIRRALRGRDLGPFRHAAGVRLLFPHGTDGAPFARLPEIAARYLRPHEPVLRARVDYEGGPHWTLFRVAPSLAPHRVLWPDLARTLTAVALSGPGADRLVPLNSCYLIALPDRPSALALSAWLNSTWLRVAARAAADVAASGFARFNARVVGSLPLPLTTLRDPGLIALGERGQRGEPVQEEIDACVAHALALGPAVRAVLARARGADPADHG